MSNKPVNTPTTDQQPPRKAFSVADSMVKILVLGTPVFYGMGRAYAEGYWRGFSLSPTVMARGFEDYIYFAFIMLANAIAVALTPGEHFSLWFAFALTLAGALLLALLVIAGRWIGKTLERREKLFRRKVQKWAQQKRSFADALQIAIASVGVVATGILVIISICIAMLLPVAASYALGSRQAAVVRDNMSTGLGPYEAVSSEEGGRVLRGRLLECSEQRCVIFSGGKFIPVSADSVRWEVDLAGASSSVKRQ